jgi:hypothetical protein
VEEIVSACTVNSRAASEFGTLPQSRRAISWREPLDQLQCQKIRILGDDCKSMLARKPPQRPVASRRQPFRLRRGRPRKQ